MYVGLSMFKTLTASIIYSLIVEEYRHVSVLQKRMSWHNTKVSFITKARDLLGSMNGEAKVWISSHNPQIAFKQNRSHSGSSSTANCMGKYKSLNPSTVIRELSEMIQAKIHDFCPNWKQIKNKANVNNLQMKWDDSSYNERHTNEEIVNPHAVKSLTKI